MEPEYRRQGRNRWERVEHKAEYGGDDADWEWLALLIPIGTAILTGVVWALVKIKW